jgi:hypothetical protein
MGPWSKVERRLRDLPDPALDLRFRFTAYRYEVAETPHWSELSCKFWITQGRRTVWSVPRDSHPGNGNWNVTAYGRRSPGWLVELCVEYLQLSRMRLIDWQPQWAGWGLVDILKACDRRIGRRQWGRLHHTLREPIALRILDQRAGVPVSRHIAVGGRDASALHDPQ